MALDRRLRLAIGTGLVILSVLPVTKNARAQLSADPYKPYNSQYEQYVYPSYPGDSGVAPNQSLLQGGGGGARSYQRFLEEEDEMDRAAPGSSVTSSRRAIGVPYYRAYRDYDRAYNRVYSPNKNADDKYLASRRSRDEVYSQYLAERDPKKKAQLLKEYQGYDQRARRELTEGRSINARRPAGGNEGTAPPRPPIPGAGTGAAPRRTERAATPAGGERRDQAPAPPSSSDILRRSETMDRPGRARPTAPPLPPPRP